MGAAVRGAVAAEPEGGVGTTAGLSIEGGELVVVLRPLEQLASVKSEVRVPLHAVRAVNVVAQPWRAMRGMKGLATSIPGLLFLGTRRANGQRDFGAVVRNNPAVEVVLEGAPYARLLVTVPDPEKTAAEIRGAARL